MAQTLGPGHVVVPEGLPGRTTVFDDPVHGEHLNGRRLLRACLESHKPVNVLVVLLGTNDLQSRYSASAWEIAQGAGALLDLATQSGCGPDGRAPQPVLIAPPPTRVAGLGALTDDLFKEADAKSVHFDTAFAAVAAERGIAYLNAGDVIESSTLDGVHWSSESHRILGQEIAAVVESLTR